MLVKITISGSGLHPSEKVVSLETRTGREQLAVDYRHLDGEALQIGWPVGRDGEYLLIELPMETFRGSWRVWVKQDQLYDDNVPRRKTA